MIKMNIFSSYLMQLIALVFLLILTMFGCSSATASDFFSEYVDETGAISFPHRFKQEFAHIGSWFALEGNASGFHDVYTEKNSLLFYQKHGYFPDGATLVKELRASESGEYTTGKVVHHSNALIKQWFVMIKDSKDRFSNNSLWGAGWGWALFRPSNLTKNIAKNYQHDCLGCHVPAQETDLIYIEGYPVLSE